MSDVNQGQHSTAMTAFEDAHMRWSQRASNSRDAGKEYSPSSPRLHTPQREAWRGSPHALAAANSARHAAQRLSRPHPVSRSAAAGQGPIHLAAQHRMQEEEEIARNEFKRKLDNRGRALVGATSTLGSSSAVSQRSKSVAATPSQQSESKRRAREPQAAPRREARRGPPAPVDSGALLNDPGGAARPIVRPSPAQRKIRKSKVYCGQNRLDPSLRVNGGTLEVGSRSRCFRSGFGAALHQRIDDEEAFIRKFTAPYAPLVAQKLWYKDSPPPQDHYQPATLSQARQRGFGAGSAELARKLLKKRHSGNVHSRSRGARSGSP